MPQLLGSSVSYRIALGPQQGRKAFMLQTLTPLTGPDPATERVANRAGFSLHAGVSCEAHQRDKRERLCRYISRPPVAVKRLALNRHGKVVYTLKTPCRDGTTQVVLDPLEFIARLAALVPRPRINLTRYHGVLAPHHRWRAAITPAGRGIPTRITRLANNGNCPPASGRYRQYNASPHTRLPCRKRALCFLYSGFDGHAFFLYSFNEYRERSVPRCLELPSMTTSE